MARALGRHRKDQLGQQGVDERNRRVSILYLAPRDINVARVEREFAASFCSALAKQGASVELVALGIRLADGETHRPVDPLSLYGLTTPFPVSVERTLLHQDSRSWAVGLERLRVHMAAVLTRLRRLDHHEVLVVYMRNYAPALALIGIRKIRPFILLFQCHAPPSNALQRFVIRHADGVIAQSHALAEHLLSRGEAREVIGAHHGVSLERFEVHEDQTALRQRLGLPQERPIAVYTGKIYPEYDEVEYLLQAAATRSCEKVEFVLVGGRRDHVEAWREEASRRGLDNVRFVGFVPPRDVHEYQLAADVLVLYYPGWVPSDYLSPGKLLGYMATTRPIVTVDLPVLRELLGDPPAATVVPADSPAELARAIRGVIENPQAAMRAAAEARTRVTEFTWDRRAARVLEFIDRLMSPGLSRTEQRSSLDEHVGTP